MEFRNDGMRMLTAALSVPKHSISEHQVYSRKALTDSGEGLQAGVRRRGCVLQCRLPVG